MMPKKLEREMNRVIRRLLPLVRKHPRIGKKEFEGILGELIHDLHLNTKIEADLIAQKTERVIRDLPAEYGTLPEDWRSWEALLEYLYTKYLKELGKL